MDAARAKQSKEQEQEGPHPWEKRKKVKEERGSRD